MMINTLIAFIVLTADMFNAREKQWRSCGGYMVIISIKTSPHELLPHTPGWSSVQATTADGTSEHFFVPNYCALWYDEVVEKFKIGVIRKQ